jgi:hypothetical protein
VRRCTAVERMPDIMYRPTIFKLSVSAARSAFADFEFRKNRDGVAAALRSGRLTVLMQSEVKRIRPHDVELAQRDNRMVIGNDAVIVCASGILPTPFLKTIGIEMEIKYGTA